MTAPFPRPGDTWRGVFTPADGRGDEEGAPFLDDEDRRMADEYTALEGGIEDNGTCAACNQGDHWACTDDGRKHSGRACECARSESGGHGPNGIGVI